MTVGLAGCGDNGGSAGDTGDTTSSTEPGGGGGDGNQDGTGGGTPNHATPDAEVEGIEIARTERQLTLSPESGSDVTRVRLFGPDGEQLNDQRIYGQMLLFPQGLDAHSHPPGTYTVEAVDADGNVIDSGSVAAQRSFEIAGTRYKAAGGRSEYYVAFDVRNTGDLRSISNSFVSCQRRR